MSLHAAVATIAETPSLSRPAGAGPRRLALPSDQDASGRSLGDEEIRLVAEAIRSGTLTSTKGRFVHELETRFAQLLGVEHACACASGTAAIHAAVAAIDPEPGDEIVTTPITDMGAIAPMLYQGAVPVFADVDPRTCNVTAETIAARLSHRTRAIVATHLFGHPCDLAPIVDLAHRRGIPLIEDCAQAYLARYDGHPVGTFGDLACFSLQQGKHVTTGEGGLVVTSDPRLARRVALFVNKGWGYGDESPDHYFLALNYRMTELQGAVAVAQLGKLWHSVEVREARAAELSRLLRDVDGIDTPVAEPRAEPSFWKYCLRVDAERVAGGPDALGRALQQRGVACAPRYIKKPAFQCEVLRKQKTLGSSRFPFCLARPVAVDYDLRQYPGVLEGLARILVLPWNEGYTPDHVRAIDAAIRQALDQVAAGRRPGGDGGEP